MTTSPALIACAVLFLASCTKRAASEPRPAFGGDPPNVLLVSIDSLRADHLGCYGYKRATSPAIDRLASEGTLFEVAVSSTSWTLPSHAAMFTGLPDSVHGAVETSTPLGADRRTVAEALRDSGYATAGFFSGPYLDPHFGLDQGFETYASCASYAVESEAELVNPPPGVDPESGPWRRAHKLSHEDVTNPRVLADVSRWLRANERAPFFLFVHMWDVHYSYLAPPPFDTMFDADYEGPIDGANLSEVLTARRKDLTERDVEHLVALYDAEIAWTDMHVGRMLALLDELDLARDTVVIVTADHGEELFDHGQFGHRKNLHEESVRIPLVVRYPGRAPAGARIASMVRMVDVGPTILHLAGAGELSDVMGRSLAHLLSAPVTAPPGDVLAVSELARRGATLLSVRSDEWKIVVQRESGEPVGLWDLRADPTEKKNVFVEDRELRKEARGRLKEIERVLSALSARHGSTAQSEGALPSDLERALESHGYVGDDE